MSAIWSRCSIMLLAALAAGVVVEAHGLAQAKNDELLLGEWWTENNQGRVRITRDKDGTYRGTTTCCVHKDDKDNPAIDVNNPNPKLRARSTVGIVIFWKLQFDDGEYVDGYVYNPRDGKTYRIEMKMLDRETLKIRGYMGIPLLGQSQIWKRARGEARPASAAR